MSGALVAGGWGMVAGSALLLGAAIGYLVRVPRQLTALVMAFGAGVLIAAFSLDLMDDAYRTGGFDSTATGFLAGAVLYTGANWLVTRNGARHRKRSGPLQPSEADDPGSGMALFVGALIDGIPESIAVGLSLLEGRGVGVATVAAIFLSNLPEGLSAAAGMRRAGRSARYVFLLHAGVVLASGLAALAGYTLFRGVSPELVAGTTALAAGGVLAMLADTMMPEAYEQGHDFTGLVTAAGFLAAFVLHRTGGG